MSGTVSRYRDPISLCSHCTINVDGQRFPSPLHAVLGFYMLESVKNPFAEGGFLASMQDLDQWLRSINHSEDPPHIVKLREAAGKPGADICDIALWVCFGEMRDRFVNLYRVDESLARTTSVITFDKRKRFADGNEGRSPPNALTDSEKHIIEGFILPTMFKDGDKALALLLTGKSMLVVHDLPHTRLGVVAAACTDPVTGSPWKGLNGIGECMMRYRSRLQEKSDGFLEKVARRFQRDALRNSKYLPAPRLKRGGQSVDQSTVGEGSARRDVRPSTIGGGSARRDAHRAATSATTIAPVVAEDGSDSDSDGVEAIAGRMSDVQVF